MRRRGALVAGVVLLLTACTPATEPEPSSDDATIAAQTPAASSTPTASPDNAALSEAVLDRLVYSTGNGPGCAAAVGNQGTVVWQGVRGMADIEAATPISESTVFDVGSVTKQFTAASALLLAAENELDLDDAVSDHVDGLPAWGDDVTLDHLIHHTSGIPDFIDVLVDDKGHEPTDPVSRKDILKTIAGMKKLDFEPGTSWAYSNSGYVLLGYVIEQVGGAPLADALADRMFDPLGLEMVLGPVDPVAGQARSYSLNGGEYDVLDWPWDISGAGGIQTTVADLVRWGDNYRTGKVGGRQFLDAQLADPVPIGAEDLLYGAGIVLLPDESLEHGGEWEGFHANFQVSADRDWVFVVSCNLREANEQTIGHELVQIWTS